MKRIALNVISLALIVFMTCISKAAEVPATNEDSLRTEIKQLISKGRQLQRGDIAPDLDSAFMLFDSAAALAKSQFGYFDSLHAWSLCELSRNRFNTGDLLGSEKYALMMNEIVDSANSDNIELRVKAANVLVDYYLEVSDYISLEETTGRLLEFLQRSKLRTEEELVWLVQAMKTHRLATNRSGKRSADPSESSRPLLDVAREMLGHDHWLSVSFLSNRGWLMHAKRRFDEAEAYLFEADSLMHLMYPPEHSSRVWTSLMLVEMLRLKGDLYAADSVLGEQFEIFENALGEAHNHFLIAQARKAELLVAKDSVLHALEVARWMVQYSRDRYVLPSLDLMLSLRLLGKIALIANDWNLFREATGELSEVRRSYLTRVFRHVPESRRLNFARRFPPIESQLLAGAVQFPDPTVSAAAAEMIVNGKGLVVDAMTAQQTAAICADEPVLDSLLEKRRQVSSRIARLALSPRGSGDQLIQQLYLEKEQLEKDISDLCSRLNLSDNVRTLSVADVQSALPENSILVDFVHYEYYDYEAFRYFGWDSLYAAVVLTSKGHVTMYDLGDGRVIDSLVREYHLTMSDALADHMRGMGGQSYNRLAEIASNLYDKVVAPLHVDLMGVEKVFISADGLLNLIPFETLLDTAGRYLIEDHEFVYTTSGRDLLKEELESESHDAIVIADPDYMVDPATLPPLDSIEFSPVFAVRGHARTPDCLSSMFSPLPMTRQEGLNIAQLLKKSVNLDVLYFESGEAREGVLMSLRHAPRVLHIATHGYFCEQAQQDLMLNSLLRSGLILAGANRTIGQLDDDRSETEDGILTAFEASGLNLVGTDLVVLSACQTGVGEVQNGEGVFGLRRAFQHAGARSLIMSMFVIPDESTTTLMERFYENWLSGDSKSSALRNASLSVIVEHREKHLSPHPLFWGGFILVGDPD